MEFQKMVSSLVFNFLGKYHGSMKGFRDTEIGIDFGEYLIFTLVDKTEWEREDDRKYSRYEIYEATIRTSNGIEKLGIFYSQKNIVNTSNLSIFCDFKQVKEVEYEQKTIIKEWVEY